MIVDAARVSILLSTYNGGGYLADLLASLRAQTYADWRLLWRDDGSSDATVATMQAFAGGGGCEQIVDPAGRLGVLGSFMALLRRAAPQLAPTDFAAFADQDDVWLPEKLARGVAALRDIGGGVPAMYCARQVLVDRGLRRIGLSPPLPPAPAFPAALTQNIATGCTVLLNRAAALLVAASRPPSGALHDWWCYLLVAAAGGRVLTDAEPVILYRQHGGNVVGAPGSWPRRALAAIRRGPAPFMADFRRHLDALAAHGEVLTPAARGEIAMLQEALAGGVRPRLAALRDGGLRRRAWSEGLLFRLWFLMG
jgi:glycosyltransferase involved in cell wall biosynthesis